jgi:hypothetical protein
MATATAWSPRPPLVLTHTSIMMHTGASTNGRLFAQTAVSLDGATVVQPAP